MKQVMEALVDRNRVRLDVKTLKTILGRKQRRYSSRRRKLEDWHITVERPGRRCTASRGYGAECGRTQMRTFGGEVRAVGTAIESHSGAFCGGSVLPVSLFHFGWHAERFANSFDGGDNTRGRSRFQPPAHARGGPRTAGIGRLATWLHRLSIGQPCGGAK